jgi:hypothetical protein
MKNIFFYLLLTLHSLPQTYAGEVGFVEGSSWLIRGPELKKQISDLDDMGIKHVVIIKNQIKTEVDEEKLALGLLKISYDHFSLQWRGDDLKASCHSILAALSVLNKLAAKETKTYLHCTAGEDRTGLVAALWQVSQGRLTDEAWSKEMCAKGYAEGNPGKPQNVVDNIHQHLTPLYWIIGKKLEQGQEFSNHFCESLNVVELRKTYSEKKCR